MENIFGVEYLVEAESPSTFGGEYRTLLCFKVSVNEGICLNPYNAHPISPL